MPAMAPMAPMIPMTPIKLRRPQEVRSYGCGIALCCSTTCMEGCSVSCQEQGHKLLAQCSCTGGTYSALRLSAVAEPTPAISQAALPSSPPMLPLRPPFPPTKQRRPEEVVGDGCEVGSGCQGRKGVMDCGIAVCCPANCTEACAVSCQERGSRLHAQCSCAEHNVLDLAHLGIQVPSARGVASLVSMLVLMGVFVVIQRRHYTRAVR